MTQRLIEPEKPSELEGRAEFDSEGGEQPAPACVSADDWPSTRLNQVELVQVGQFNGGTGGYVLYMRRYEVTVSEYRKCVAAGACQLPLSELHPECTYLSRRNNADRLPMDCVTRDEAYLFCASEALDLPTGVEWAFAATSGQPGFLFPWGDEYPTCDRAQMHTSSKAPPGHVSKRCAHALPATVGSRPLGRSRQGVDDLVGNVSEWVADETGVFYPRFDGRDGRVTYPFRGLDYTTREDQVGGYSPTDSVYNESRGPGVGFRCVLRVCE